MSVAADECSGVFGGERPHSEAEECTFVPDEVERGGEPALKSPGKAS